MSLVVSACLTEDSCCGVNCGPHGTLNSGKAISNESSCCHCTDGYTGERCGLKQLHDVDADDFGASFSMDFPWAVFTMICAMLCCFFTMIYCCEGGEIPVPT